MLTCRPVRYGRHDVRGGVDAVPAFGGSGQGFVVGSDVERRSELSPREREVLQLIAEGKTSHEIAERLFISAATVDTHRRNIARKLDRRGVAELTKYAIQAGLTQLD